MSVQARSDEDRTIQNPHLTCPDLLSSCSSPPASPLPRFPTSPLTRLPASQLLRLPAQPFLHFPAQPLTRFDPFHPLRYHRSSRGHPGVQVEGRAVIEDV